jgi:hypothetical protein
VNRITLFGVTAIVLVLPVAARADEKSDIIAKQKAAAEANWKKLEIPSLPPLVETPKFLICSRLSPAKTKALGATLETLFATAAKALKFDEKSPPWPGKLATYVVPDRGDFVDFMRKVVKKAPSEDDMSFSEVRGDEAMLVIGTPKAGQVDAEDQAKIELTTMLLKRKMGAGDPPPWVAIGFAKSSAHRAATKSKVTVKPPAVQLNYLWADGAEPAVVERYSTYVIDYMAYGPMADSFATFVGALRPGETGLAPSMKEVLESVKMDEATLELYARNWKKPPMAKLPPLKKPDK